VAVSDEAELDEFDRQALLDYALYERSVELERSLGAVERLVR